MNAPLESIKEAIAEMLRHEDGNVDSYDAVVWDKDEQKAFADHGHCGKLFVLLDGEGWNAFDAIGAAREPDADFDHLAQLYINIYGRELLEEVARWNETRND